MPRWLLVARCKSCNDEEQSISDALDKRRQRIKASESMYQLSDVVHGRRRSREGHVTRKESCNGFRQKGEPVQLDKSVSEFSVVE